MPESRDYGGTNLSQLSTEELEQILRQDAEAPEEQETDTDFLLEVMEVLAERNRENAHTPKTAEEAWESFQKHYAPKSGSSRSAQSVCPWIRRLVAAVAALVLILCIPVTARAFGWEELWDVVARWAKETFSFVSGDAERVSEPSSTYDGEYTSLQDLLKRSNRPYDMVPTWIPDGFVLKKVEKDITPEIEMYRAVYEDHSREFRIQIQTIGLSDAQMFEITNNSSEIYESHGVKYYIFQNMDELRTVWISNGYECSLSGALTIEEIKSMINSIEKGSI